MADVKISALPPATTPLAGTEVLPIVQSSATKKVSIADVTAGRAISASGVTVSGLTASKPVFTDGSKTLTSSGTLATDQGGTGLTSYSQGDLVYYNTGTTLTALPKNTSATRYLANTGTSNNPAWAQVDLSNGVTGTLPTGNGGTGATTTFTAGSVVFAGSGGNYNQDNANFFWDDTNNRLGIGSNAPKAPLDVKLSSGRWMTTKFDTNITLSAENDAGNPENMRLYGENLRFYTPQGGFTAANLTLGAELKSTSGDFHVYTGNLVIGTSGKGIDFSVTSSGSGTMTSELLADYEEGTWTPTLTRSVTNPTITSYIDRIGTYTKIGNRVCISCNLRATISATGSGNVIITNLPFTAAGNLQGVALGLTTIISAFGAGNYVSGTTVVFDGATLTTGGSYLTFSVQYEI